MSFAFASWTMAKGRKGFVGSRGSSFLLLLWTLDRMTVDVESIGCSRRQEKGFESLRHALEVVSSNSGPGIVSRKGCT